MSFTGNDETIAKSFRLITSRLSEPERLELEEIGKRASDHINLMYAFHDWDELRRSVMAIRLGDGSCDGVLYANKRDAVRHQAYEMQCAYVFLNGVGPGGTSPRQMAIYLKFQRDVYNAGYRMPDPDDVHGGPQMAMTTKRYDYYKDMIPATREPTREELAPIIEILRKELNL